MDMTARIVTATEKSATAIGKIETMTALTTDIETINIENHGETVTENESENGDTEENKNTDTVVKNHTQAPAGSRRFSRLTMESGLFLYPVEALLDDSSLVSVRMICFGR